MTQEISTKEHTMAIYDAPVKTLTGEGASLHEYEDKVLLVVNVASKCGLTPQYTALEELQKTYADRGFSVLGFPCNQFGGQEPGTSEEISEFCSSTYGVTFPIFEKIDVNGANQSPLYAELTAFPGETGEAGEIQWNFEKFLIGRDGEIKARFAPQTTPDSDAVISAIETELSV
jgi:glutathione peroxidase